MSDKGAESRTPQRKRQGPQAVPFNQESIGRRKALKVIGGSLAAATVLGAVGSAALLNNAPPEARIPKPPEPQESVEKRGEVRKGKLNRLLAASLKDPNRKLLEQDYVNWASDIEEVRLGLQCVVDPNSRISLIEKSYALRTPDSPSHKPLNSEQIAWADSENMHPETLAMSIEARIVTEKIMKKLIQEKGIEWFRPDIADRIKKGELDPGVLTELAQNPKLMLLSEGGMARLAITESGQGLPRPNRSMVNKALDRVRGVGHDWIQYGFANIGTKPAIEMTINATNQPKVLNDQAVEKLAGIISSQTGLNFVPGNIPGSEKDAGSSTGGALGLQIMPARALSMYDNLNKYTEPGDPLLHPLDPIGSMVLAYLYIAQGVLIKDGYQDGYVKPPLNSKGRDISEKVNREAIKSWNADVKQIGEILTSDKSYRQKFAV